MPIEEYKVEEKKRISNLIFFSNDLLQELKDTGFNLNENMDVLPKELTMNEFIGKNITISYSNTRYSLDLINNITEYKNIRFIDDAKKSHVIVPNINVFDFYKRYKEIIVNLYKPYNVGSIQTSLFKQIRKTRSESFIDAYLKNYTGAPYSTNPVDNFIFIIRSFPFFKVIFNKQFLGLDKSIFYKIISDELDPYLKNGGISSVPYADSTMTNRLMPFLFNENRIHNLIMIDKNSHRLEDYFFSLKFEPFLFNSTNGIENVRKYFNSFLKGTDFVQENLPVVNLESAGLVQIASGQFIIQDKMKFMNFINPTSNRLERLFALYLLFTERDISTYTNDYLKYILSYFVINLYFIFQYTRGIGDLVNRMPFESLTVIEIKELCNASATLKYKKNILFFKIISAFSLYQDQKITTTEVYVKEKLNQFSHFLYLYNYFKSQDKFFFPLFLFLSGSDENVKVIPNKKNQSEVLDNLVCLYDKIFKNTKIFIMK